MKGLSENKNSSQAR